MRRLLVRLRGWLAPVADRPLLFGALAILIASPSLGSGLAFDDLFHRHFLLGRPALDGQPYAPGGIFSGFHGDPAEVRRFAEIGFAPWFTLPGLRLSFFRPLSELTHRLDYALWPDSPWLMHLHSLVWLGAMVAGAALVARRTLGAGSAAAAFAALLYAVDCTHVTPASWIASRNSVITTTLAWFAWIAHDRWRRDGWRAGALLAPALAAAALLAGEGAVALFAWLVAHALFLDHGRAARRLLALLPCFAVGLTWHLWYRGHGFGAFGSGPYLDPASEPLEFAKALLTRAPLLLLGTFLLPQVDAVLLLGRGELVALSAGAALFVAALAWLFAPLLRREPAARFFALGGALSLLPICATIPTNRTLPFVSLAAAGVLAIALARHAEGSAPASAGVAARRGRFAVLLLGLLAAAHLLVGPLLAPAMALVTRLLGRTIDQAMASYPRDAALADDDVVVVSAPDFFFVGPLPFVRAHEGGPRPRRLRPLSLGPVPIRATRRDDHALELVFEGGLLVDPLSQLFRGPGHPMRVGERVALDGLAVEVTATTDDGRPSAARFVFERRLDDPHVRWLAWERDCLKPWRPPAAGETVTIVPARAPWTPKSRAGEP